MEIQTVAGENFLKTNPLLCFVVTAHVCAFIFFPLLLLLMPGWCQLKHDFTSSEIVKLRQDPRCRIW